VLAYNYLSTKIIRDEGALTSAAGEILDTLEGWEGEDVREHALTPVPAPRPRQGAQRVTA